MYEALTASHKYSDLSWDDVKRVGASGSRKSASSYAFIFIGHNICTLRELLPKFGNSK